MQKAESFSRFKQDHLSGKPYKGFVCQWLFNGFFDFSRDVPWLWLTEILHTGQMLPHLSFLIVVIFNKSVSFFIVSIFVFSIKVSFILQTLLKPLLPSSKTSTCFSGTASLQISVLWFLFYLTTYVVSILFEHVWSILHIIKFLKEKLEQPTQSNHPQQNQAKVLTIDCNED